MLTILGVGRCTMGHDTFSACAVTLVLACRRLPSRLAAQESYRQTTVYGPTRGDAPCTHVSPARPRAQLIRLWRAVAGVLTCRDGADTRAAPQAPPAGAAPTRPLGVSGMVSGLALALSSAPLSSRRRRRECAARCGARDLEPRTEVAV